MTLTSSTLAAGSTIAGRYRLASLIGEGGMASVWCAEDLTLKRSVAIKLMYFGVHRNAQAAVDHFLREARIAASIQHRNVISIVDFGTTELGVPYMVMELLQGESFAARLEREPRLDMDEVVRLASMTLRGLAAVHDAGIVHRDLKPQNIFLQQDSEALYPKILDFGISRSIAAGERRSAVATQEGLVVGTPHYMAPEQARGEADIDKRADIYAMGAIIYEGVTGRMPFDANTTGELLVKIISTQAPAMREVRADVPQVLSDCVAQAMAPNREHRFMDAKVFRRALQSAADSAFPLRGPARGSDLPRGGRAPQLNAAAQAVAHEEPSGTHAKAIVSPAAAPANNQLGAWGDFEGLEGSAERAKPRTVARESAPSPAKPQPEKRTAHVPEPAAREQDGPMLGESPLDGFGAGETSAHLDLDYRGADPGRADPGRPSRHSPAPKAGKPASQSGRASRTELARKRGRLSALWILPALLLIVTFVMLLAPGLFSAQPADEAAALQRQAQSPATRASDRRLVRTRPGNLAKMPPALRELAE